MALKEEEEILELQYRYIFCFYLGVKITRVWPMVTVLYLYYAFCDFGLIYLIFPVKPYVLRPTSALFYFSYFLTECFWWMSKKLSDYMPSTVIRPFIIIYFLCLN